MQVHVPTEGQPQLLLQKLPSNAITTEADLQVTVTGTTVVGKKLLSQIGTLSGSLPTTGNTTVHTRTPILGCLEAV